MRVLYLGLMTGNNGFTRAFKNNVSEYMEVNCGRADFNKQAVILSYEFKPDLVFIQIQAPNIIDIETLAALKWNRAFVINWTGDLRNPIPQWYYDVGKHIDLTCFSNMQDVKTFKDVGLGSEYLEIGFDPNIYKPKGSSYPMQDIVFFGNNYDDLFPLSKYRIEMVKFLQSTYGNKFGLYGNGWVKCNGNLNHSQEEEARGYRGAKIAINLSHFDYERYNSDRILRIMGTGVPICLTKGYKGIEQDYQNGEHLEVWNNFDELKQKIDFYLDNDSKRLEMAKKGSELVHEMFTFEQMIKNLIKLVK